MKTIVFSSWAQPAAGAADAHVDPVDTELDNPTDPPARATLAPAVVVENTAAADRRVGNGVDQINMVGPEHIIGLEAGQIAARYPIRGSSGSEAINLAAVEFTSTDLPWRFSPARAGDAQRLRPWLVLVVVPISFGIVGGTPLPTMTVPVSFLPDLAESWASAHVQLDDLGPTATAGRSRLLCPRKLPRNTALQAAIVPAFQGGVQAGLGQKVDPPDSAHAPAWTPGQAHDAVLPVYDYWQFSTGADEDFEFLARRISPAREDQLGDFGHRAINVDTAFWPTVPLTATTPAIATVSGALRPFGAPPPSLTADQAGAFASKIAEEIAATKDGDLGPPLRGGRHTQPQRHSINTTPGQGDWVDQVNGDPGWRMIAARGAEWVNANQEQLMADAWKQAGQIREAARRLAMNRAAVAISDAMHARHVAPLTTDELITLAAPSAPRARLTGAADQPTLHAALTATTAPTGTATTTMARLTRPATAIGRAIPARTLMTRAIAGVLPHGVGTGAIGARLAAAAAEKAPSAGASAASDPNAAAQTAANIDATALAETSLWVCARTAQTQGVTLPLTTKIDSTVVSRGPRSVATTLLPLQFRVQTATTITADLMHSASTLSAQTSTPKVALHLDGLRMSPTATDSVVRGAFDSPTALRRRLAANILRDDQSLPSLDLVLPTPDVPAPLAIALLDRDPEWLLPGIGKFPLDRATLLTPDPLFVESVLLGANVELLTEFLWREFPTDRRGTPIARFWPHPTGIADIGPIHQWAGALGNHTTVTPGNTTFLLIRAELFNRYPDTIILAAQAELDPAHPGQLRPKGEPDAWLPADYTIPIDPSTRAVAFPIAQQDVSAPVDTDPTHPHLGWFFVLLQPHTSPHFGFDLRTDPPVAQPPGLEPPADWNALTWDHVLDVRGFASARRQVTLAPSPPPPPPPPGSPPPPTPPPQWGGTAACAADVARIALQRPAMVALHASTMVPTHG